MPRKRLRYRPRRAQGGYQLPQLEEPGILQKILNLPVISHGITAFQRIGDFPTLLSSPLTREEEIADALKWQGFSPEAVAGRSADALRRIPGNIPTALKSLIPFGGRLGLYEQPEGFVDPFRAARGAAESGMTAAGFDPESKLVRGTGIAAGFTGSLGLDPLTYTGAGLATKAAPPSSMLGKALHGLGYPSRAMRGITEAGEQAARQFGRAGEILAKPIAFADIVKAPLRGAGSLVSHAAEGTGAVADTAKWMQRTGHKLERAFTFKGPAGQLERAASRAKAGANFAADNANAAVNFMSQGGVFGRRAAVRALRDFSIAPNATGYLRKVLGVMGDEAIGRAVNEIAAKFGKDWPRVLQEVRDAKELGKAIKQLGLGAEAERLVKAFAGEMAQNEATRFSRLMEFDPELMPMDSPRVSYSPRVIDPDARKAMYERGLWQKFTDEGRKILEADGSLSPEEIERIIAETEDYTQATRAGLGEYHRTPLGRHLSTAEYNAAARRAGLTDDAVLALEHPGIAYGRKELRQRSRIIFEETKQAVGEASRLDPKMAQLNAVYANKLDDAKWLETEFVPEIGRRDFLMGKPGSYMEGTWAVNTPDGWRLVDEDFASALKNVAEITVNPKQLNGIAGTVSRAWQKVISVSKSIKLNFSLGYHFRNMIDDTARMLVGAGAPAVADGYMERLRMLGRSDPAYLQQFADGSRSVTLDDIREALVKEGKVGGMWAAESPYATGVYKEAPRGVVGKVAQKSQEFGEFMEDFRAEACTIGLLNKYRYMPFDEALQKAASDSADILYRYSERTAFQRNVTGKVILFDTFLQKNLSWQVGQLLKHPFRQSMALRAPALLFGEDLTAEERELLPDWVKQRNAFTVEKKGDTVVVNTGFGLSVTDLNKLWPTEWYREGVGSLVDQLKVPLELISGKYIFMDLPIDARRRIYTPDTQKLFETFFPGEDNIHFGDFATRVKTGTKGGDQREYWVVPAWLMYAISNLRPANDLRKVLDPRNEGKAWWLVSGQKEFTFDLERMRQQKTVEQIHGAMRDLEPYGVVAEMPIFYRRKGVTAPESVEARAERAIGEYKALQRSRRRRVAKR